MDVLPTNGPAMYERLITGLMLVVATIHLLPLSGFVGTDGLASLYGINIVGNDLEILMRHRALLLGIFGAFFVYAAFTPSLQPLAFLTACISITSFLYLAWSVGEFNQAINRVVIADLVAGIALVGASACYLLNYKG